MAERAQHILGLFGADSDLRRWALKLGGSGRRNGKKRAITSRTGKFNGLIISPASGPMEPDDRTLSLSDV